MNNGVLIKQIGIVKLKKALKKLPGMDVLVGIPGSNTMRDGGQMTNAQLGYLHEFGAPEANVPARPALFPGIRAVQPQIVTYLLGASRATLKGNDALAMRSLHAAGLIAVDSVKAVITRGIEPPLADSTLRRRASRKKGTGVGIRRGARFELAAREGGGQPGITFAKPLIDTGQYRQSFTYVLRKAGNGT